MNTIRIYTPSEEGYKRLEKAARILTAASPIGTTYRADVTYFDFGQDWKWTTLIAESPKHGSYQALCPRDHEEILTTDNLLDTLAKLTHGKFWLDKED